MRRSAALRSAFEATRTRRRSARDSPASWRRPTQVVRLLDGEVKTADCAFAEVDEDRFPVNAGALGIDGLLSSQPAVIRMFMRVAKQGRTTNRTGGKIVGVHFDMSVPYVNAAGDEVEVLFKEVLEILSTEPNLNIFCSEGDSGSLVYTEGADGFKEPVGLLFSRVAVGRRPGTSGFGYANPIQNVLDALNVEIVAN